MDSFQGARSRRLWSDTALGLQVCFKLRIHLPVWDRRMHQTPIRRSAPTRTKQVETVTRTAALPFIATGRISHAVESHRFPERRPFIPEVHPTSPHGGEGGSLSSSGARVRGNHAVSNPFSSFASWSVSTGADGGPIRPSRFGASRSSQWSSSLIVS